MPSDKPAAPARVKKIATAADKLGGPLAEGAEGDYLLENSEIAVVIEQIKHSPSSAPASVSAPAPGSEPAPAIVRSGGDLIDAADSHARRDEISRVAARFNEKLRPFYENIAAGVDPDGTAWVEVTGHEINDERIKVATRYALGPVDRAVMITTAIENRSPEPLGLLELGDAVAWGSAQPMTAGKQPDAKGDINQPYASAVGRDVAYLIAPVKDADVASRIAGNAADVIIERDVALPPGGRVQYDRVFAIAPRGDPVAVATEFFYMQGGAPGGLMVKLVDAQGQVVAPPPGARLFLDRPGSQGDTAKGPGAFWMRAPNAPDDPSILGGEVPPGRYELRFEGGGRHELRPEPVEIKPGAASSLTLQISDADRLQ